LSILTCAAHRYFLISALFFGLIYIFIVPPFQVPDEGHHFYRAYHIAEGHWFGEKTPDQRFGGELPASLIELERGCRYLRYDYEARFSNKEWVVAAMIPLQAEKKAFADFPNVAYYVPLPYLVQAFSVRIGSWLDMPPLFLLYVTRVAGFLFWLTLLYVAVRLMPFHKNSFAALALLPSSLFINSGMTADSFTYGLCYLLFAFLMRLVFGNKDPKSSKSSVGPRSWLIILGISLAITLSKVVYLPMLLLCLLIPKEKFIRRWPKWSFISSLFFINLIALFLLYTFLKGTFISYENYNHDYREDVQLNEGVNPSAQLDFVINDPIQFMKIALRSHVAYVPASVVHCVGKFGWEKNYLPFWMIAILILSLIVAQANKQEDLLSLGAHHRLIFLIAIMGIVAAFTIVIYMQWSPVGNEQILSLGGRYYLPLLPLFFFFVSSNKLKLNQQLLTKCLRIIVWVGLLVGIYAVLQRYWF